MQALRSESGGKIAAGETDVAALATTAAEHGVSADKLQELFAQFGGPEAILSRIGGLFDRDGDGNPLNELGGLARSEEHTSELQSLMRISYAVFCLKKKSKLKKNKNI